MKPDAKAVSIPNDSKNSPKLNLAKVESPDSPTVVQATPMAESPSKAVRIKALKPAPKILPASMPSVILSGQHATDCFMQVGDLFPAFELPDAQAALHSLEKVQGERLTIVVVWSSSRPLSVAELRDLALDFAEPYAELGVKVVAINPLDTPDAAAKALSRFEPDYPLVYDAGGAFFKKLGRDHLPRTYLLDKRGRILWFDIEWSRTTRRQLEQAIHAALGAT